jgi:integrase
VRPLRQARILGGAPEVPPPRQSLTGRSHAFREDANKKGPIVWLSKRLGHSSLDVTSNVYRTFERATRQREAQAMAGVFGF